MANKTVLHIRWCARLSIHSSFQIVKLHNRIQRTNAYSVKKIYLFLESNDQYGRKKKKKKKIVQLWYYMTREFSSTFSRINRQTSETSIPTEKCFKLAQKPCGRVGKRKYNLNGISTALGHHFRWKLASPFLRFLDYSYWPVRDLELVLRDAANVHTEKKKNRSSVKSESDGPLDV